MSDKVYKVAVVDDELEILDLISRFLKRGNKYSVSTYSNPKVALSSIDESYDIVLLDIMMPQMSGLELLHELKEKNPNIKVIMMTAYSTLDKVLKSHKEGAAQYIMKPFKSLQLLEDKMKETLNS